MMSPMMRGGSTVKPVFEGKWHAVHSKMVMRQLLNTLDDSTLTSAVLWMCHPWERIITFVHLWMTKPAISGSYPAPTNWTSLHVLSDSIHSLPTTMGHTRKSYDQIRSG